MPVQSYNCSLCAGLIQLDTAWAGQAVACPLCQGTLIVPGEAEPRPSASNSEAAITLACPSCSGPFQALVSMAGQTVLCPHCGAPVVVPPVVADSNAASAATPGSPARTELWTPPPAAAASLSLPAAASSAPALVRPAVSPIHTQTLTSDERSQRRLRNYAVIFTCCLIVLVVVFYFLSQRSL